MIKSGYQNMLLLGYLVLVTAVGALGGRVGDGGLPVYEDRVFSYFPQISTWAQAGVSNGIPARADTPIIARIKPGENIQQAIDATEKGVVLLLAGTHKLLQPLLIKTGVVLRGEGSSTVVQYGKELSLSTAVIAENVKFAGLEDFVLTGPSQEIPARGIYANIKDLPPNHQTQAAVVFSGVEDCWIQNCEITGSFSDPLYIGNGTRNVTLRDVSIRGAENRGAGHGRIHIQDAAGLLFYRLKARDIRMVLLDEPLTDSVFKHCFFGTTVQFGNAAEIKNNLFEDCVSLLPPGHLWAPFSKHVWPLGAGNVVMNHRCYHHGTDALEKGLLPEHGIPYAFQSNALRGDYNPYTLAYEPGRLIRRHQSSSGQKVKAEGTAADKVLDGVENLPEDIAIFPLRSGVPVDAWIRAGPFTPEVMDQPVPDIFAGTELTWGTETKTVGRIPESMLIRPTPPTPEDRTRREGKFGRRIEPAKGAKVDLLKAVEEKWNRVLLLATVLRVPETETVKLDAKAFGGKLILKIDGQEVVDGEVLELSAGDHTVVVAFHVVRHAPFEQHSLLELAFDVLDTTPQPVIFDTPPPEKGALYPVMVKKYMTHEDMAVDAVLEAFGQFRGTPGKTVRSAPAKVVEKYPGTFGAWLAEHWLTILENAPYDEISAELTPRQWAELAEYYAVQGVPERTWAINRAKKPEKIRIYYGAFGAKK